MNMPKKSIGILGGMGPLATADLFRKIVTLTDAAKHFIIDEAYDPVYGARPLRRYVQHTVETLIGRKIIADQVESGDTLTVDVADGQLVVDSKTVLHGEIVNP